MSQELSKENEWYHSSLLLLADIVGSGILALAGAFAKLGWFFSIVLLIICCPLNYYTGVLLCRIKTHRPNVTTYGELMENLFGGYGNYVGWIVLYLYVFLILGEYHLIMARSVQGTFYDASLCRPVAGIIASVIVFLSNQVRTLHNIALLSIVSVVTIFIVLTICLNDMISDSKPIGSAGVEHNLVASVNFWDFYGAFSTLIFAWAGQKIYLEIMTEMRDSKDFTKSLSGAYPFIFIGYAVVGFVGYGVKGRSAPGYLLDVLDFGATYALSLFSFVSQPRTSHKHETLATMTANRLRML